MAIPAVPLAGLVVIESQFVFCGLKAVINGPPPTFNGDQSVNCRTLWAPCAEIGDVAIVDIPAEKQTASLLPLPLGIIVFGIDVAELMIAPVVQSRAFGTVSS